MRRQSWFLGILLAASFALVIRFVPVPTVGAQPYYPQFVMGTLPSSGTPLTVSCPNDTSTGTVVNQIVKLSSGGNCINAQVGDFTVNSTLSTIVGIVVSGAGTANNATVAVAGVVTCLFDNSVTIADWVSGSAATAGNCSDAGAATSAHSTQGGGILGFAVDGGAAGLHKVFLQQQQGSPGFTLWLSKSRLDASGFNGQFLLRQSSAAAGVGLQIGGSGSSNPCLADNGALLAIRNGGTGTGCTGDADFSARLYAQQVQAPGTGIASAATIAPTGPVVHVTGTTQITTITAPTIFGTSGYGGCLTLIPDGAWSLGTGGNISPPNATALNAIVNQPVVVCYDNAASTWYPVTTGAPSFTDSFYPLPIGACWSITTTGTEAAGNPTLEANLSGSTATVYLVNTSTAAASVIAMDCDIVVPGRSTSGKGVASVTSIDVFYGLLANASTSISAPTLTTNTFPATGAAAADTQASFGGSLTVTPGTLQTALTTYPNCYHEHIALGTPTALNTSSQKLTLDQKFNQTGAVVNQVYLCDVQVNYTWTPF